MNDRMVLVNGKVYVERGVFAEAVLMEGGVIRAVGTNAEVMAAADGAEVVDCSGRTVIPGLNDSHCHLLYSGICMAQAKLTGAASIEDIVARGRAFLAERPEACAKGITGMGWNEDLFTEGPRRAPNRHDLDRISTEVPIIFSRVCGHVGSVNTRAIEMLGLTKDSPQFDDGVFDREEDGYPNGVFKENVFRARDLIPDRSPAEYGDLYAAAADHALSCGVTTVQSNDTNITPLSLPDLLRVVEEAHASGRVAIRHRHQLTFRRVEDFQAYLAGEVFQQARRGAGHPRVEMGPLKLFKDGSLGGRTATLRQPYHDDPGNTGVDVLSNDELASFCAVARDAGVQVITHAIGDRAISDTVDAYLKADPQNRLRNIVNHCQITDLPLLRRMAENNICDAFQPIFLDYDLHITEDRVGHDLASTSYAFNTLNRLGAHIGYGTDAPVEDCNPFPNLCCAVTRTDRAGFPAGGWFAGECVDVETAVDTYTVGSAYLEFHEADKGRIKPDFLADMVILDQDIFTCNPMDIRNVRPVMTIVGGGVAFQR